MLFTNNAPADAKRHPYARIITTVALGSALVMGLVSWNCSSTASDSETSPQLPSTKSALAEKSLVLDAALSQERIVAVGERGHILLSDDFGSQWRQVTSPTDTMLTAIDFDNTGTGLATGHDATILRTTNNGENWQQVYSDPEFDAPLLNVIFLKSKPSSTSILKKNTATDARAEDIINHSSAAKKAPTVQVHAWPNAIAIGAYGLALESYDMGITWESTTIAEDGEDPHWYGITQLDDGTLLAAGEFGSLFRRRRGEDKWQRLPSPYEGTFFGITAWGQKHAVAYGIQGNTFYTEDGGNSWHAAEIELNGAARASLMGGAYTPNGELYLVGLSGTVLRATDQRGVHFALHRHAKRPGYSSILPIGTKGQIITVGDNGIRMLSLKGSAFSSPTSTINSSVEQGSKQ